MVHYVQALVANEKYLKVDEQGEWVIDYPQPLKVFDFHTHLSDSFGGKQKSPNQKGAKLKYCTLPPITAMDLSKCYWTDTDYLIQRNSGLFSVMRFAVNGINIFNDMVAGGTFDNSKIAQDNNMIYKSVVLPISTAKCDLSTNALQAARQHPDRYVPFCSVHPFDPDYKKKIHLYKSLGAKGFKLKLTDMEIKDNWDKVIDVLKVCHEAQLPALFHTGAILCSPNIKLSSAMKKLLHSTRTELFGELLYKLPRDMVFIFGHCGTQEYKLVADYMKQFPATYGDVSTQSTDSIRYLIKEVGSERLLFGSDWPALPPAITLSRVLQATEGNPEARDNILHKNAERLLGFID